MKYFHLWTSALLLFYILFINFDYSSVNGLERKDKRNEVTKVKCKEHVDEALRQYWDHEKGGPNRKGNDEDDDESDEVKTDEEDDEDSKQDSQCDDDKDDDKDDDNDDDEDDDEDKSDEKDKHEKDSGTDSKDDEDNSEDEDQQKSEENKDEDKDDDDSKESDSKELPKSKAEVPKQKISTKNTEREKVDEDDEDSDEDKNESNLKASSNKVSSKGKESDDKSDDKSDENDNEDDEEEQKHEHRSRTHIDDILRVYEIGSLEDTTEQNLILSIFRELKKLYESTVKPLEIIYKYRHITTRLFTDAELFAKPMVLFLGGKSTGKTSLVNYLLGIDSTPWQLKTGLSSTYPHFTILSYGENYTRLSPTELSADFAFSSLQQFGQPFLEHYIEAHRLPINILQKMTIIDSPGLLDLITKGGQTQQAIDNDVYQWFIDRSDVIYIVIDVNQLHLSHQLKSIIEQLKGRDVRFIISKSDVVSHSQIISLIGQLLWILSPIMPAERPPQVYALTTVPQDVYDAFLDDQEVQWLKDLSDQISGISRIESRIAALRRHAVRVRNHAKLIDCYLATFYKNKGIFTFGSSSRSLAADITENPHQYRIYSGAVAGQSQNISRYDLPDPGVYREFFRSNPLIDFKPLTSTCSYFKGCPIDKLDIAIAYQLPELVGKYKKLTQMKPIL